MKLQFQDGVLSISEIKELDGEDSLCQPVRNALPDLVGGANGSVRAPSLQAIEIDLSQTEFLNSSGLGELIALQKMVLHECGKVMVQVLNPPAPIEQLFELTRLHKVFPILKR